MSCTHQSPFVNKASFQTSYRRQSCKQCLLELHISPERQTNVLKHRPSHSSPEKKKSLTPLTDPICNFPSPGGEVLWNSYKPQKLMRIKDRDVRPSEVQKLIRNVEQFLKEEESWENNSERKYEKKELMMEETPSSIEPLTEQLANDREIARSLVKDEARMQKINCKNNFTTTLQRMQEGTVIQGSIKSSLLPLRFSNKPMNRMFEPTLQTCTPLDENRMKSWERLQRRAVNFSTRPVEFTSYAKNTNHIPGYRGCIARKEEVDVVNSHFQSYGTRRASGHLPIIRNYWTY